MNFWTLPWLDMAILLPLLGALWVSRFRDPAPAFRWALVFSSLTLLAVSLASTRYSFYGAVSTDEGWSLQRLLFGRLVFRVDQLNAPLVVLVALLHLLVALATARTKMRRFSVTSSLASESIRLAVFSSQEPVYLIALLAIGSLPPYFELVNRGKPTRVYLVHASLFIALMLFGWAFVNPDGNQLEQTSWATVPLIVAMLVRSGTFPAHTWVTDWFEHASFGNALLHLLPLPGVYFAVRVVLPYSPDWALKSIGYISMVTAVYAAGMATIQKDPRRFFAFLFTSHVALILVGMELQTTLCLTGSFCLWISAAVSLGGFGLTLRALEARFGQLSLAEFHGLYDHTPTLAVCFLVTGLASVGFPGTSGFVASELLMDGAVESNIWVGVVLIATAALNGIAVVRVYFIIFTGKRHTSAVAVNLGLRERIAILTMVGLIVGGGIIPQKAVDSRHEAVERILETRRQRVLAQQQFDGSPGE